MAAKRKEQVAKEPQWARLVRKVLRTRQEQASLLEPPALRETREVIEDFLQALAQAVLRGERVYLPAFGVFRLRAVGVDGKRLPGGGVSRRTKLVRFYPAKQLRGIAP